MAGLSYERACEIIEEIKKNGTRVNMVYSYEKKGKKLEVWSDPADAGYEEALRISKRRLYIVNHGVKTVHYYYPPMSKH